MQQQEPSRNCWKEGPEWPLEGQQSQPKETSPSVRYPSGWATGMSPSGDSCRLQLAREAWNQDSRLSSPRRQKRCGLRGLVDRSGRLCGLFQPQAVTVGQRSPNCRCWVDRRPACPCWLGGRRAMPGEGTAGFGFFCSTTHTHTPQGRGEGEEGLDGRPRWVVSVQRGLRLSPAVTGLASDAPQEVFWHLLGPEADRLAMSAAGQMGEPPWSLCYFGAVGRQVWNTRQCPGARLRRPRWSLATGFDLRELGAAQRP